MVTKMKFRSKTSLVKRFKVLPSGKLKHWHAYTSHLAYSKSTKQLRHLRKSSLLNSGDYQRLKKMLVN